MTFTELAFLPLIVITLLVYSACKGRPRSRLWVLLVASNIFYGWWDPLFLPLLWFSIVIDYLAGAFLSQTESLRGRRALLAVSMTVNVGLLSYFKYAQFLADNLNEVCELIGGSPFFAHRFHIILPVGISFYTFQSMSYALDIYFRRLKPCKGLLEFATFVSFFPQLVAGPILRASEFLPQLERIEDRSIRSRGLFRVLYGLVKKMWLADTLALQFVDRAFADPAGHAGLGMWLAIYGYAFQIFLDFSAYSDIAIGSARMFGFDFPENFRSPYLATGPQDFWKRWHISFSPWLRDYLYIPLGGNRRGPRREEINLLLTMLIGGLWHGAAWTFVGWGALHGFYLVLYRKTNLLRRLPDTAARLIFFHLVCLSWILFRSPSAGMAVSTFTSLFSGAFLITPHLLKGFGLIGIAWLLHDLAEPRLESIDEWFDRRPAYMRGCILYLWALGMLALWEEQVGQAAFIYFKF
jgi:D-alanyl-lipoteichoic acid acyltransferase DltB (MBOAT superfamily)